MTEIAMNESVLTKRSGDGGQQASAASGPIGRREAGFGKTVQSRIANLDKDAKLWVAAGLPLLLLTITAAIACFHFQSAAEIASATAGPGAGQLTGLMQSGLIWTIGAVLVSAVLFIIGGKLLSRDVLDTVEALNAAMQRIGNGDVDCHVPHQDRRDLYGVMARELEQFRAHTAHFLQLRENEAAVAAEREDLRKHREDHLRKVADQLEKVVADTVGNVATAAGQLHRTADTMADAADISSIRSERVAKAMEEASSGVTAAAAASDEFAMSIGEISRQAASSADLARRASRSAAEADTTMSDLAAAAKEVSKIVELIQTIAKRTNLLALNASIEAARGGEAGRGFAVVAAEVKDLAAQTTRATEDVARQISDMQDSTGASVQALRQIGHQVHELETTAISIASAVDQQSVAGQDLARSIDLAARGTDEVQNNIALVREASVTTGNSASEVLAAATELDRQTATLRSRFEDFLRDMRQG